MSFYVELKVYKDNNPVLRARYYYRVGEIVRLYVEDELFTIHEYVSWFILRLGDGNFTVKHVRVSDNEILRQDDIKLVGGKFVEITETCNEKFAFSI